MLFPRRFREKIIFEISKASKFSIMHDPILVLSDLVFVIICTIRGSFHDNLIHICISK
jgi:hypothetical protein